MITFDEPIEYGYLIKRYKRFFMDIELLSGEVVTAHTPNTGSMTGLLEPGSLVLLTKSSDRKRKLSYTAQAIKIGDDFVGINTHLPNKLIKNSLSHPLLKDLTGYSSIKSEQTFGKDLHSRVDFFLSDHEEQKPPLYLEIKNVTMKNLDQAQFPDTVSLRARKHLDDLMHMKTLGFNAGLWFIIQRMDCCSFSAAKSIDALYGEMLVKAHSQGVFIRALSAAVLPEGITLKEELPIIF